MLPYGTKHQRKSSTVRLSLVSISPGINSGRPVDKAGSYLPILYRPVVPGNGFYFTFNLSLPCLMWRHDISGKVSNARNIKPGRSCLRIAYGSLAPDPEYAYCGRNRDLSIEIGQHIFDPQVEIVRALNSVNPRNNPIALVLSMPILKETAGYKGRFSLLRSHVRRGICHQRRRDPLLAHIALFVHPGVKIVTLTGSRNI